MYLECILMHSGFKNRTYMRQELYLEWNGGLVDLVGSKININ
jgi:hypothetical protein